MNDMVRWRSGASARDERRGDLRSGVAGAAGGLVMIFAATLAVIMALATALLALSALAWRVRPRAQRAMIRSPGGHAWIAYSWERPGR